MRPAGDEFVLDAAEVDTASRLGESMKAQFVAVGRRAIAAARADGIPDYVVMSAIVMEALLLAAHMHLGTTESFPVMAECAIVGVRLLTAEGLEQ
jgi:hypothetical protein